MTTLATPSAVKQAMMEKLAQSALNGKEAVKLKLKPLVASQVKDLGLPAAAAGFVIPYFTVDGKESDFWRLRYLEETRKGFDIVAGKKPLRYVQASNTVNEVYLPPLGNCDWQALAKDADAPLIITEGELKAACACLHGLPTIGLGGVFCFKSTKAKVSLLPMLEKFNWKDRAVTICYDSDAILNPMVAMAERQLAEELTHRGAAVYIARIPSGADGTKQGVDDYIMAAGIEAFVDVVNNAEEFAHSAALRQLNEEVVYIRNPGIIFVYNEGLKINPSAFTSHAFANRYHEMLVPDRSAKLELGEEPKMKLRKIQTAPEWLRWEQRAELSALTFEPGQERIYQNKLNEWTGFAHEPKKGDVTPWLRLMDHLFKGADKAARQWFERWCAYPLQYPGTKLATGVLLWGLEQGSGKSMAGHTLMALYGKYATEIKDRHLEDERFEWAINKQFVMADDITGHTNRKLANTLKTMITQKELSVNPKFIPSYSIPDYINYYFTSNDPDAFYMDDGDRRMFIHEVLSDKIDTEFRKLYIDWRESEAGIAALFYYLLDLDLGDFDPQAEAMMTDAKRDMQRMGKSDLATWIADLRINPDKLKMPGDLFTATELLMAYTNGEPGKVTANGIARELRRAGYKPLGGESGVYQTANGSVRLYAIRNAAQWTRPVTAKVIKHYDDSRQLGPKKNKLVR